MKTELEIELLEACKRALCEIESLRRITKESASGPNAIAEHLRFIIHKAEGTK